MERNSIEPPAYLPPKKPKTALSRPKVGLGDTVEPPKPKTAPQPPVRPEWAQLKQDYDHTQQYRQSLYEQRATLVERCNKALVEKSSTGKVIGAIGGGLAGRMMGENGNDKFWYMLLMGGLAGYLGHLHDQNQDADIQKKLTKLRKAEAELKTVESELFAIDVYLANLKTRLEAEPKYEIVEVKPMEPAFPMITPAEVKQRAAPASKVERRAEPEPEPTRNPAMMSTAELADKEYKTWPFTDEWRDFLGEPEHGFHMVIYGKPGQGKSTLALKFAKYLADNFGRTLYVSSEEGHSKTMSDKAKTVQSPHLIISDFASVEHVLNERAFPFVVLDSANNMKLGAADVEHIRKVLKDRGQSLITIHQATKDGDLRGSEEVKHNADIVVQVEKGNEGAKAITTKNRYAVASEMLTGTTGRKDTLDNDGERSLF